MSFLPKRLKTGSLLANHRRIGLSIETTGKTKIAPKVAVTFGRLMSCKTKTATPQA
jgi:hypothetical protein